MFYFYHCLFFSLIIGTFSINQAKHGKTLQDDGIDLKTLTKECIDFQDCTACSFEEMKNDADCAANSYYKVKQCFYYDSNNSLKHESHEKEKCHKSNAGFYFSYISIFSLLGVLSYYLRKKQKEKILGNVFDKLKPVKYK